MSTVLRKTHIIPMDFVYQSTCTYYQMQVLLSIWHCFYYRNQYVCPTGHLYSFIRCPKSTLVLPVKYIENPSTGHLTPHAITTVAIAKNINTTSIMINIFFMIPSVKIVYATYRSNPVELKLLSIGIPRGTSSPLELYSYRWPTHPPVICWVF